MVSCPSLIASFVRLFAVWLLCAPPVLMAQKPLRIFESVGTTHEGTQFYASLTKDVLSDRLGRIWYGTLGSGLYRYDGYDYVHYQYDPQDSTTIDSDRVWALMESTDGDIWAITYEGLNRLDAKKGNFIRYGKPGASGNPKAVCALDNSRVMVGMDKGLFEWNIPQQKYIAWKPAASTPPGFPAPQINRLYRDGSGRIWAASSAGLLWLHPADRTYDLVVVLSPKTNKKLPCNIIYQQKGGDFWIGCDSLMLQFFPDTRTFGRAKLPDTMHYYVYNDIVEDPGGSLWLSSNRGVVNWDPRGGKVSHFYSPGRLHGFFPGTTSAMCLDRLGNLWIACPTGLRKTNINPPNYKLYQLKFGRDEPSNHAFWVVEDKLGGILMFNGSQMFYSPRLGADVESLSLPRGVIPLPFANHVGRTPEGDIHVSWRRGGVSLWDPARRTFKNILPDTVFSDRLIQSQYYDSDNPQVVWISTADGLWKVNRRTWQKRLVVAAAMTDDMLIEEILEDGRGGLWCLTSSVVGYISKRTEQFTLLPFNTKKTGRYTQLELMDGVCDKQGSLWVGAIGGLVKIEKASDGTFHHKLLTERDGLPTHIVNSLSLDRAGYIWAGFYNAYLLRMHPETFEFHIYDVMNPLQTQPHIRKSLYNSKTGLLFDVTQEGIVVFDPLRIKIDSTPPEMVLTNIYVNNNRLTNAPEYTGNLVLKPGENAVTIEFAGIHLQSPYSNQYQYKLLGYNENWVACPAILRRASYTNLPPGNYRFLLRAANSDGIWSKEKMLISFVIKPSYWQTNWFMFLILLTLAAIGYAIAHNRLQQRRLKEEKKLAEQQTRYKSLFLANMSHEIRTPMNAIIGLSEMLEETPLGEKQKTYLGAIRHSSEDLLRIVNDILDYSKIESGQYTFHFKAFDLPEVLNHIQQTFGFLAQEKGIELKVEVQTGVPVVLVGDAVRLKQILGNLVGNAIKFTDSGSVEVGVSRLDTGDEQLQLQFIIRDTGIGISPDKIEQVFESFNQIVSEDATARGGAGLGLSICRQLVEQQGGTIHLQSRPGEGTSVTVVLSFLPAGDTGAHTRDVTSPDLSALRHCRILLVEDIYFNQLLATELLKSRMGGHIHIVIAENGQIALEKAVQEPFDLVLMDVKMPVMDGLEATRRLRALPADNPLHRIPIIGLTANAVPEELEKCRLAGMDAWVTKPIKSEELLNAIYRIIETV